MAVTASETPISRFASILYCNDRNVDGYPKRLTWPPGSNEVQYALLQNWPIMFCKLGLEILVNNHSTNLIMVAMVLHASNPNDN